MANTHGHSPAERHERLRQSARRLIDCGTPPPNRVGSISAEALKLLYQQASTPETAPDALRLLHELQTYQVELDLLYEQLQANEQELAEELAHYKALFDKAPAAYLVLDKTGNVIEANKAASALFDGQEPTLEGRNLNTLMGQPDGTPLATLTSLALPDYRHLTIHARPADNSDTVLMILTEAPNTSTVR